MRYGMCAFWFSKLCSFSFVCVIVCVRFRKCAFLPPTPNTVLLGILRARMFELLNLAYTGRSRSNWSDLHSLRACDDFLDILDTRKSYIEIIDHPYFLKITPPEEG